MYVNKYVKYQTKEMEYVNNNYLGPNPAAVIGYYNDLITFN